MSEATIIGPNADSDKDGLANLIEYTLGLSPLASNPNPDQLDRETIDANCDLHTSATNKQFGRLRFTLP